MHVRRGNSVWLLQLFLQVIQKKSYEVLAVCDGLGPGSIVSQGSPDPAARFMAADGRMDDERLFRAVL